MSEENIGPDVQPVIDRLWDDQLGPRMASFARIDGQWLWEMNKYLNAYAQIIVKFRYGHVPLQTRLNWDAAFLSRLKEGEEINAKYLAAAVPKGTPPGEAQLQIEDLRGSRKPHTMDMADKLAKGMRLNP